MPKFRFALLALCLAAIPFAFGTLLHEGTSIRLTGQDSRRGTFSHRHSTLVDYETGGEHQPLLCADRVSSEPKTRAEPNSRGVCRLGMLPCVLLTGERL